MKVMWKAACAVVLLVASLSIEIGCGEVYRPIATPAPVTTGNPSGTETEAVLSQCPTGATCNTGGSVVTGVNVSGDSNFGNKVLQNVVGSSALGTVPGSVSGSTVNIPAVPMAFDYNRTSLFTANTTTDSVTQLLINQSTAGFSANTRTILLDPGSHPTSISFQYAGLTYTQEYVVNSGATATCPTGSLTAIAQAASEVKATACLPTVPVFAWIYRDQSKVFVLDNQSSGSVYVVNATSYKITNTIPVGANPIKAAQSADGQYIFVLNSGGTITVIDGQAEVVVGTVSTTNVLSSALPIDMGQDPNYNDTTANSQYNHIWILQADGTVSVYDATNVTTTGTLTWITSIATITTPQLAAGVYPTNLALMRDGSGAYVGLGGTTSKQLIAINTSQLATGAVTPGVNATGFSATTPISVGVSRSLSTTFTDTTVSPSFTYTVNETTTPTVTDVAVSRGGSAADLAKAYANTITNTTYTYFDSTGAPMPPTSIPAWCTAVGANGISCPNLYNGTSVVAAAANGTVTINSYITTIPAPSQVMYCNPNTNAPDAQKACPALTPATVLGRS